MSEQAMIPLYLPEDIFLQIFRSLPVKSLGKCMCVCKAWNCLIKNPSFISTHLNNQLEKSSRNNSDNLFLVMSSDPGNEFKVRYFLQFDDQEFSKYTQLQHDPFTDKHYIVGCCNGLLCSVDFKLGFLGNFTICNPIIRKCVRLPQPQPCFAGLPRNFIFGFGFDSRRNDYKLLKITKKEGLADVQLYSLKKNFWEILDPPKYDFYSNDFMVFVNGVVHLLVVQRVNDHERSRRKLLLLGFDMADEVFKEIMLPESLSNAVNRPRSRLYVLSHGESSSIAVTEFCVPGNCSIWIMKKYGVVETWTKMFSFEKIENRCFPRILGFRKNGGLLLRTSDASQQLKISNEIENLEIQGRFSYIFSYVESLVLLDQVIDARGENGAKNVSKASNSIKGATNDFTKSAAGEEATDDLSDH